MIIPYDESAINAADQIIRRINPQYHVVPDENRQCMRISSKAYSPSSGQNEGMSIDVERLIIAAGMLPRQYVIDPVFTGAVSFSASQVRSLGLWVGLEPISENPFHGQVWSAAFERHNKFTKTQKDGLAVAAAWYVALPGVELC